jgi:drug/metabolite transporter (DMT)-like permease
MMKLITYGMYFYKDYKINTQLQNPKLSDYINLFALSAIWGTAFIGIEIAIRELDVFQVTFGRVIIAFLFLLPFVLYKRYSLPKGTRVWSLLFLSAVLNTAIPFSLINAGQEHITSGMSALMIGFGPFITLLLAHYMTSDEKISKYKLYSVLLGFIGLVMLLGDNILALNILQLQGQGLVLLASLCYVLSSLIIRKIYDIPYLMLSFLLFGISAFSLLPIVIYFYWDYIFVINDSSLAIIYLGILPTAIASIYRVKMVQEVGVQFMSQVSFLIPIFALIWAWIVLGEIPKYITLLALVIILFGLYIRNKND